MGRFLAFLTFSSPSYSSFKLATVRFTQFIGIVLEAWRAGFGLHRNVVLP
jgi:hypothetical protein